MDEHTAALEMAEEAIAQADAFMGALDQAGKIGQHELALVHMHDAELRLQGGEGIVGDLRLGAAGRGQEGGLAGIGQADQAGIGDQLQPQPDPALLARPAFAMLARRLVGRGLEMRIAETAVAALAEHDLLAGLGQVEEDGLLVLVQDLGPDRDLHGDGRSGGTRAVGAAAVIAAPGLEMLLVAIVDEGVQVGDHFDDDVAAPPAIAAVRSTELDELLAPEADAARAAVAGFHEDLALVEEFHDRAPALAANWIVIPRPGRGIHALGAAPKAWIPAPSAGMTAELVEALCDTSNIQKQKTKKRGNGGFAIPLPNSRS